MIKSARDKRTAAFLSGETVREFRAFERQAQRRVAILNEATRLEDLMALPSNRFKALGGDRAGYFSIRISTISGGCVSGFTTGMLTMSKSSIIIEAVTLPAIHPGEILAEELTELGVSVSAMARAIDVPQSRMSEVIRGERGVTADTALRLARYFGNSARFWLNLQAAYDLARVEAESGERIAAVVRPHAA